MTASAPGDDRHDAVRELAFVGKVLSDAPEAVERFVGRMQCVPRFTAHLNQRFGRPLGPEALRDLVQDVLTDVWRRLRDYRGESSLESWAYGFCALALRNAIRRQQRDERLQSADCDTTPDRRDLAARAIDRLTIATMLRQLPVAQQVTLRLKHFEDLTFEEIGTAMRVSSNTAKTRYYRALQTLALLLDTNTGDAQPAGRASSRPDPAAARPAAGGG